MSLISYNLLSEDDTAAAAAAVLLQHRGDGLPLEYLVSPHGTELGICHATQTVARHDPRDPGTNYGQHPPCNVFRSIRHRLRWGQMVQIPIVQIQAHILQRSRNQLCHDRQPEL